MPMLGFGFSKLLVLALLIFAIWTAFKYVGRVEEVRQTLKRARDAAERGANRRAAPKIEAEDMEKCRVCDAYVAARGAAKCGRGDCPW
jgi:uncharacterized protein